MNSADRSSLLVCGFGSVGRRHFENFRALGCGPISLFRTGRSTLEADYGDDIAVYSSLSEALADRPDGVIVANPTSFHLPTALAAAEAGCHLLIEKPVSHRLDQLDRLLEVVDTKSAAVLVGYQYRQHPGLLLVKELVESDRIGQIIFVHARWGEYLPNWHPWEDYRDSYSARHDLGGGVILTLSHVFDYLRWLFGDVLSVSAWCRGGIIGTRTEEICAANLIFENGALGQICLDYLAQPPVHTMDITGSKGRIRWAPDEATRLYKASSGTWTEYRLPENYTRNTMFLAEAENFAQSMMGLSQPACSLLDGVAALRVASAVKASCSRGGLAVDLSTL